jgi:hypothetical protein
VDHDLDTGLEHYAHACAGSQEDARWVPGHWSRPELRFALVTAHSYCGLLFAAQCDSCADVDLDAYPPVLTVGSHFREDLPEHMGLVVGSERNQAEAGSVGLQQKSSCCDEAVDLLHR